MPAADVATLQITVHQRWWVRPFFALCGFAAKRGVLRLDANTIERLSIFIATRGVRYIVPGSPHTTRRLNRK